MPTACRTIWMVHRPLELQRMYPMTLPQLLSHPSHHSQCDVACMYWASHGLSTWCEVAFQRDVGNDNILTTSHPCDTPPVSFKILLKLFWVLSLSISRFLFKYLGWFCRCNNAQDYKNMSCFMICGHTIMYCPTKYKQKRSLLND